MLGSNQLSEDRRSLADRGVENEATLHVVMTVHRERAEAMERSMPIMSVVATGLGLQIDFLDDLFELGFDNDVSIPLLCVPLPLTPPPFLLHDLNSTHLFRHNQSTTPHSLPISQHPQRHCCRRRLCPCCPPLPVPLPPPSRPQIHGPRAGRAALARCSRHVHHAAGAQTRSGI